MHVKKPNPSGVIVPTSRNRGTPVAITERSRNWAEQRKDLPQPGPGPNFYRGSGNPPRGRGGNIARGEGGGDDRSFHHGNGRRPYNRGWAPRGKRRN
jgi:hypothetical protein